MKKISLLAALLLSVNGQLNAHSLLPDMKKEDFEVVRAKAEEVKERAQRLALNPLFWSAIASICYLGPRNVAQRHPLLSIVGAGCVLSYLKGDLLADVEGAEVKVRLLKSDRSVPHRDDVDAQGEEE